MLESSRLRKKILAVRDGVSPQVRHQKSRSIIEQLFHLEEIEKRERFFVYVDFRSEVETRYLLAWLLRQGKEVMVPHTLVHERRLLPVAIRDMDKDLAPGFCSIPEPREELRTGRVRAASEIETIILPGSVFDEKGGRLGYGGGYYDRFLANEAPVATRIGLAFELQVVDQLILGTHDERLDILVTEKRVIQVAR